MFDKYGPAPKVDDLEFNPKFPCDGMSGYHLSEQEVGAIALLIEFMTQMRDLMHSVDLAKALKRMEGSIPIDDASLISPGDAIFSLGNHTTNPLEDLVSLAKIWTLMSWVIRNATDDFHKLMELPPDERSAEMRRMATESLGRKNHFARNLPEHMRMGGGIHGLNHNGNNHDNCPICEIQRLKGNGEEASVDEIVKIMDELINRIADDPQDKAIRKSVKSTDSATSDLDNDIKRMLDQMERDMGKPNDIN